MYLFSTVGQLLATSYIFYFQIYVSRNWGFTKYKRAQYIHLKTTNQLIPDGVNAQYKGNKGPLSLWKSMQKA